MEKFYRRRFPLFVLCLLATLTLAVYSGPASPTVKVVVMGIAQDGGIPHIGCTQRICQTQRHLISSLAVVSKDSVYLIDATPDLREQYFQFSNRNPQARKENLFDGIFLTHAHMGHYTGLVYLGKESISTNRVPVYCSGEMAKYLSENAPWSLLTKNQNIEIHPFKSGDPLKLDDFSITALQVPHRKEFTDTHGFLIQGPSKSLLYIPDIDSWDSVQESLIQWLQKSDFALLDGTFYSGNELPGRDIRLVPHPTIQNSLALFQSFGDFRCQIYFTHLNHTNPLLDNQTPEFKEFQKTPYKISSEWQEFSL